MKADGQRLGVSDSRESDAIADADAETDVAREQRLNGPNSSASAATADDTATAGDPGDAGDAAEAATTATTDTGDAPDVDRVGSDE